MGGPLQSLRWLVKFLTKKGLCLKKGSLVIPGSPVELVSIECDTELRIEIEFQRNKNQNRQWNVRLKASSFNRYVFRNGNPLKFSRILLAVLSFVVNLIFRATDSYQDHNRMPLTTASLFSEESDVMTFSHHYVVLI